MTNPGLLHTSPAPTKDECTMAFLAHLLQVFSGFVGPLVIFCIKQDSRFVRFHALQSLIWQLCYMGVIFIGFIGFFVVMFTQIPHIPAEPGHPAPPPTAFFLYFPILWLLIAGGGITNIILGIVYGIKANRGEWAGYPILGAMLLPKYLPPASYTVPGPS